MAPTTYQPVMTVSASYGSGGSVIAPRLAEALGIPFIDRLLHPDASQEATPDLRSKEGLIEGEQAASPTGRFLSYFARAASVGAMSAPDPMVDDDADIRKRSESALVDVAAGSPAVVLGRAGAVVLAKRPRAFHVRLDGDLHRRIAWASSHEALDKEAATKRQAEADKARTTFVKRLYRADPADPNLYHLVMDPTVFGIEPSITLLLAAAWAFFEANP